jgi:hypothetical protein
VTIIGAGVLGRRLATLVRQYPNVFKKEEAANSPRSGPQQDVQ